ncbi:aspartyl/asparaginyl beta-hydroxylase domain-containing protein [Solimonas fluminis]|uniref:Aspartyl/asparaginyl beta-hydroxylase domain-containing protein n=1 Tax=Solimonas fluminis TaxID=2086571 RepID=A0A2S5TIT3_9GAMM|nr:aspartyl/asparaginyl beta-hydroxylase domain-containing protein [Solimonas fluminis]
MRRSSAAVILYGPDYDDVLPQGSPVTVLIALFLIYAGSLLFVRLRNRVHLPLGRQLTDFSTFTVPLNLPAYLLSRVSTRSRLPPVQTFPQLKLLQDNWETIRDEALALYGQGHIAVKNDLPGSSFYRDNRWKSFYLKIYDLDIPSARALAPKTRALIDQVPGMNLALFAVLMPGKRLTQHHDPFAFSLRYSLGLSTPNSEKCGLMINGEHYAWRDGDGVLFDETYIHSAYNDTETPRLILMTDIDRPMKLAPVQWFYFRFARFFNSLFYIDNLDSNISGIGNRLSGTVVGYKATMKGLKKKNPRSYKLGKWALHLGLVGLIVAWAL